MEGAIVAGPHVRAACLRHMNDLDREDIWFDVEAASTILEFCQEVLRLAGGKFEGQPFIPEPWQAFVVGSLFGWKWVDTGQRRFQVAYVETAKGSGKTPLAAAIGFWMLMADGEERAEVYAAATDKDQAEVLFRDAVAMYQQSSDLFERLLPRGKDPNITNLSYRETGSFFRPLSYAAAAKSGKRTSCALVDEFHEHPNGELVDKLEADFKFRTQPLMFIITNSGSDLKSACGSYHTMAIQIAGGEKHDDRFFSYVCALDEDDDPWTDSLCWVKANPSLGRTITESYIEARMQKAINVPVKRAGVERLNFCIWTDAEDAWVTKRAWKQLLVDFDPEEFEGRKAWIGLDLSRKRDLTSMSVVIENGKTVIQKEVEEGFGEEAVEEPCFLVYNAFWLPMSRIREREDEDGVEYSIWAEDGHMDLTAGAAVKMSWVAQKIAQVDDLFDVQAVAYDAYAITDLEDALDEISITLPLVEHPQGFRRSNDSGLWMPSSIEKSEEAIDEKRLKVKPNPILTWNVANTRFERDAQDNRKLSKRKATGRIDGTVALVMALGAAVNPQEDKPRESYLATGGLAVLE